MSWENFSFFDDNKVDNFHNCTTKSSEVEILGIKTDNKTNFNKNIKSICSKATQKLRAPLRTASNLNIRQIKL